MLSTAFIIAAWRSATERRQGSLLDASLLVVRVEAEHAYGRFNKATYLVLCEIHIRYTTDYSKTPSQKKKTLAVILNQEFQGASGIKKTADSGIIFTRSRCDYYNGVII